MVSNKENQGLPSGVAMVSKDGEKVNFETPF